VVQKNVFFFCGFKHSTHNRTLNCNQHDPATTTTTTTTTTATTATTPRVMGTTAG
jgi:hypothetical protein